MSLSFVKPQSFHRLLPAILVTSAFFFAPDLMAQEAEAGAKGTSLLDKILAGGGFMIPIGILSVGTITLYVFNGLQLMKSKWVPKNLEQQIMDLMTQVRVRSAVEAAASSSSFAGRMLATSLPHVDATNPETLGRESVEDAIAEFTARESAGQMVWVQYLSVIAQMAPMMGLMGTVWGMVSAFETLGDAKGSDPAALAADISVALMTTLGGLVVALPSIFGYYLYKNQLNSNIKAAHALAADAMDAALNTVNAEQQMAKVPEGLAEG